MAKHKNFNVTYLNGRIFISGDFRSGILFEEKRRGDYRMPSSSHKDTREFDWELIQLFRFQVGRGYQTLHPPKFKGAAFYGV